MFIQEFEIVPTAKGRPRFNLSTGRTYTDKKTREFEETIGYMYKGHLHDTYIKVTLEFNFRVPKSYSKSMKNDALNGYIRPTKGDIDNYIKAMLDGLNRVAFTDDRLIAELSSSKRFADRDYIKLIIEEI